MDQIASMLLGVVGAAIIAATGIACLRLVGIARTTTGIGLAPGAGIAVMAVVATWSPYLRGPEMAAGLGLLGVAVIGIGLAVLDAARQRRTTRPIDLATCGLVLGALVLPLVVLGQAVFVRGGVPNWALDGAHHVELVEALRQGGRLAGLDWYPTGFHAPAAALLSVLPFVDSASGGVGWAVAITLVAPLAVFGLGTAVWGSPRVGAAAALLLALTYQYPYAPHLFSVWPMAAGLVLVVTLWTTTVAYLAAPGWRLAALGGLLVSGIVLTHGTEVYTAGIGVAVIAAARWRVLTDWRVAGHLALAVAVALVLALPYLPTLGGWAAGGGAVQVGQDYFGGRHGTPIDDPFVEVLFWASAFSSGVLGDLPFRAALLGFGVFAAFGEARGRALVAIGGVLAVCVAIFRYVDLAVVRDLFALTLPWGVDDRLLMTLPLLTAPLGGLGLVRLGQALAARSDHARPGSRFSQAQWRRAGRRVLVLAIVGGVASVLLVTARFSLQTGTLVTYSADDAAALAWLAHHAQAGDVVMNDGVADAGIWAPYKARVTIALPRTRSVQSDGPEMLVYANIGSLGVRPDVRAAACQLGIRFVYRGEATTPLTERAFPSLAVLEASPALEEGFRRGDAAVFATHLNCTS